MKRSGLVIDGEPATIATRPIAEVATAMATAPARARWAVWLGMAALLGLAALAPVDAAAAPRPETVGGGWRLSSSSRSPTRLVSELERLTEGLSFTSESDAPLSVVIWRRPAGRPTAPRLAQLAGEPHPELVEQSTVDEFFAGVATPRAWHDAEERAVARRYAAILDFFKTRLSGARVFRFGHLTIRAYVVGVTPGGDWIGLATTQVET